MTSVLAEYINANILVPRYQDSVISSSNGRLVTSSITGGYVLQCFLSRNDSPSGDFLDKVNIGNNSGVKYVTSGYIIRYGSVSGEFNLADNNYSGINFNELNNGPPDWLRGGLRGQIMFGDQGPSACMIEIASGRYGSMGIDKLVYSEISGIRAYVTISELRDTEVGVE